MKEMDEKDEKKVNESTKQKSKETSSVPTTLSFVPTRNNTSNSTSIINFEGNDQKISGANFQNDEQKRSKLTVPNNENDYKEVEDIEEEDIEEKEIEKEKEVLLEEVKGSVESTLNQNQSDEDHKILQEEYTKERLLGDIW